MAGATAVVVVLCLVGLALLGDLPGVGPSSGPAGPVPYSQARTRAVDAAAQMGGSWSVLYAGALNGQAATSTTSFGSAVGLAGCTVTGIGAYATSNLTFPAQGRDVGSGSSPAWLFLLRNSTNDGLLVAVLSGVASPVASISGPSCTGGLRLLAVVPDSAIDSTAALATAGSAGGTSFLAAHPTANVTVGLTGGLRLFGFGTGSQWSVLYSACGATAVPGSSAPAFNVTINATLGTLVGTSPANAICTGTPALPLAHAPRGLPTGPVAIVSPRGQGA